MNRHLILLLQIIEYDRDIESFSKQGFTYSQIARLIQEAIDNQFIIYNKNNKLMLTELGKKKMKSFPNDQVIRPDGGWILPIDDTLKVDKIDLIDVYIPKKRKPFFYIPKKPKLNL